MNEDDFMTKKMKMSISLFVVFVSLSIIDILFNAGAIVIPWFGSLAKSIQEIVNESIQISIVAYLVMMTKK